MKVPSFVYAGERVEMKCNAGMPALKSMTWLKDGKEFYSFKFNSANPISITNLDGVTVNVRHNLLLILITIEIMLIYVLQLQKSSMYGNSVTLDTVSPASSGLYTCRMEFENPTFDVAEMSGTVKVVAAPQSFYGSEGYKY